MYGSHFPKTCIQRSSSPSPSPSTNLQCGPRTRLPPALCACSVPAPCWNPDVSRLTSRSSHSLERFSCLVCGLLPSSSPSPWSKPAGLSAPPAPPYPPPSRLPMPSAAPLPGQHSRCLSTAARRTRSLLLPLLLLLVLFFNVDVMLFSSIFIDVQFICSVALISAVQQSSPVAHQHVHTRTRTHTHTRVHSS